jgi:AcrR family transcriptional regulator
VRRAVLDAAADLFARQGVDAVSLRDIASDADVHLSLIGRYVGTRDELIDAVLDDLSAQVAVELVDRPLEALGWELDSAMGRWTRVLLHFVTTGRGSERLYDFNPVESLARVLEEQFGTEATSARVRAAQIGASALGWRIFEDYLVRAGSLDAIPRSALRDDLHAVHRMLGALAWPTT